MANQYDTIIIGGGHNGLVAAATLAQAGKRVLVLEQRPVLGGAAATEEVWPGVKVNTGVSDAQLFQPAIIRALGLERYGLKFYDSPAAIHAPQADGRALTIYPDDAKTVASIAQFSKADAERWPAFRRQVERMAGIIHEMILRTPPDLGKLNAASGLWGARGELLDWSGLVRQLKGLGSEDMMEFVRLLPMPVQAYLEEWFESDALKGALGANGIIGMALGPRSAGTNVMFFYQAMGGFPLVRYVVGGVGQLSEALAAAAREKGATIRTGAAVESILTSDDVEPRAIGVRLAGGEEVHAATIISNADPRRTLFGLVGPQHLEPETMKQIRNIIYRGVTAKINLALDGLPSFAGVSDTAQLTGHLRISPSLDYLEKASDAVKYGRVSDAPYIDAVIPTLHDPLLAPPGKHIMAITVQYAPYSLREGNWEKQGKALAKTALDILESHAPGLKKLVIDQQVLTPLDWEQGYGLTEGSIYQGHMGLDQLLVMRPIPGMSRYETPIKGLYLCGAGAHPGGGLTGAPGYNAARYVLGNKG